MSRYLIGVGGTGAKCVEATVHLAAAGVLPREPVLVQFVDPDGSNGSLNRAIAATRAYAAVQQPLELGTDPGASAVHAFRTPVRVGTREVWTPFADTTRRRLGDVLGYQELAVNDPGAARLFDVLYSSEEREEDLGVGFRGHPSIGAAVLAHTLSFEDDPTWAGFAASVDQSLQSPGEAHVFLAGSIFGGTGAAGLPTIGRLVREDVLGGADGGGRLGAALALPYFSFQFKGNADGLRADAASFIPNSQAALKYYHQKGYLDIYDALYVFGEPDLQPEAEASVGGSTQTNAPHPSELYGALAAADFFHGHERKGLQTTARSDQERIGWSDLPWMGPSGVEERVVGFARFAFAYLGVYHPVLREDPRGDRHRYPWLIDHFDRAESVGGTAQSVADLAAYCRSYLSWFAAIHGVDRPRPDLLEWSSFASKNGGIALRDPFSLTDSDPLMVGDGEQARGLRAVWERMCSAPRYRNVHGFDAFVRSLYAACTTPAA